MCESRELVSGKCKLHRDRATDFFFFHAGVNMNSSIDSVLASASSVMPPDSDATLCTGCFRKFVSRSRAIETDETDVELFEKHRQRIATKFKIIRHCLTLVILIIMIIIGL